MTDFRKRVEEESRKLLEQDFISQQLKGMKSTILENHMTEDARMLFEDVRKTRPELAKMVEQAIVDAVQSKTMRDKIDAERMKAILQKANVGDFRL